ncbi:protein GRAVITROPIC IN THE LIGHT 1 [Euphorbia lathyris]|uniref:protein GRAVITROPIC IN THE LIGHT 1 n=1 Tax=Euphorbia lathyris TaxID=212925 RepID=UPI0033134DC2
MESVKLSSMAPKKSKFARTVSKVLHLRTASGIAPEDDVQKLKSQEKFNDGEIGGKRTVSRPESLSTKSDEKYRKNNLGVEALVAKLFATISSAKAAYAQLQCAQSPYDVDGIQAADQLVVTELKNLSELKRRYNRKQFDPSPGTALVLAEVEEQKSVCKTYEIMGKKLESQLRLKESEIMYLEEKLEESKRQNQSLEMRLNQSGQLYVLDNLRRSGLSPSHFVAVVQFTVKSIRTFVKLMIDQMRTAGWDLDAAANSIVPDIAYWRADDKCFAFESFICREMFDAFNIPNFGLSNVSLPEKSNLQQFFFKRFTELKSVKAKDYLTQHPTSTFAQFCRAKYLQLIHPRMEASFFGNLQLRTLVNSGELPDNTFFTSFAEMAKRVWLLHCLAFSFEPEASIFQVSRGCRFSEVYMESVAEEALVSAYNSYETDPPVAFTVVPGFRIGKTVIQCEVYLCQTETKLNH